ncbi:prolyl oligopeptidase family serine peptidase [Formosa sediminum]|uniref:Prolyl oligopeptidase family serine peptidase n=1 Tax=Formosa sediminum TaxID=2594004 RepID=A0A516GRZ6_9FLAO|nr:alpha/beta hydrolase fold domain-containing protein [Formosa sediminum]QDO94286.1 prolyl oligopeptidase family serine peptidase [Formosa sediminum]
MNYQINILCTLFFCICTPLLVWAQNAKEQEILDTFLHKEKLVYKTVDGQDLDMTIFYPSPELMSAKNPWMMYVHGGGWAGGSPYNILKKATLETLKSLLGQGVICIAIEYRLAKGETNAYDAVVDAKDAARFLLKHAKQYKLHKKQYGIWGGSAGGHLSLVTTLGNNSNFKGETEFARYKPKFKCVVSYFPFTSCLNPDLRPNSIFEDGKLFERLLGAPLAEKPELAKLLSPTELLRKSSPPILLIHGDKDTVLPIINSTYMLEVSKEKKANVELLTIKNAGHSFHGESISPSITELNKYAVAFIMSHLN